MSSRVTAFILACFVSVAILLALHNKPNPEPEVKTKIVYVEVSTTTTTQPLGGTSCFIEGYEIRMGSAEAEQLCGGE